MTEVEKMIDIDVDVRHVMMRATCQDCGSVTRCWHVTDKIKEETRVRCCDCIFHLIDIHEQIREMEELL